ncbi:MAG: DNRLRE domain-containing protein [Actinobacteria bacterium]|nr:DNRLRE domain-containing protein [Actinomycetota bacterium]
MSRRAAKILMPALLCATIVFGLVGASAASLNITSASLVAFTFNNVDIVTGQTYVLYPSHDSFTNDKAKNTNYGSEEYFAVTTGTKTVTYGGQSTEVKKGKAYLSFDVSGVCAGAVTSATLQLTGPSSNNVSGSFHYDPIEASWDESTITKNNKPSTGDHIDIDDGDATSTYTVANIDVMSTLHDSAQENGLIDSSGDFNSSSDTALYGWELKDWNNTVWYSSEHPTQSLRPTLTIVVSSCP